VRRPWLALWRMTSVWSWLTSMVLHRQEAKHFFFRENQFSYIFLKPDAERKYLFHESNENFKRDKGTVQRDGSGPN
jgi:hypothetical protein